MRKVDWSVEKLISTAQAYDRRAARLRDDDEPDKWGYSYASERKIAFDARKWARAKEMEQ